MTRGYRYTSRLGQRARFQRRLTAGVLAAIGLCALAAVPMPAPERASLAAGGAAPMAPRPAVASATPAVQRPPRLVYPYSVVPGGVASQVELARIVRSDTVVATHYASFDVARARSVKVSAPRAVHVSYRKGDQVYWTAKKVMLKPGEILFTDGRSEMRARCANRISDLARFPVEAQEPDPALLDASFEQGQEEQDGALVNVTASMLADAATHLEGNAAASHAVASGAAGGSASGRAPRAADALPGSAELPPGIGALREMGLLAGGWEMQAARVAGARPVFEAVKGTTPPLRVAVEVEVEVEGKAPAEPPASDPRPFVPAPDPGKPPPPDRSLADPATPAEVPEPATRWLLAAALTALLALRRTD